MGAAPVAVMVLRVHNSTQAASGTDVGWRRWRRLWHDRDLLFGLPRASEIIHNLFRLRHILRQRLGQHGRRSDLQVVTARHWLQRHVAGGLPAVLEIVGDGRAHSLIDAVLWRREVATGVTRTGRASRSVSDSETANDNATQLPRPWSSRSISAASSPAWQNSPARLWQKDGFYPT